MRLEERGCGGGGRGERERESGVGGGGGGYAACGACGGLDAEWEWFVEASRTGKHARKTKGEDCG